MVRPLLFCLALTLLFVLGCDRAPQGTFKITIDDPVPVPDSKDECAGRVATQEIKVKNISDRPWSVIPSCFIADSEKVQIAEQPRGVFTIPPNQSKTWTVQLLDYDDPPDGLNDKSAIVHLKVKVEMDILTKQIRVLCEKPKDETGKDTDEMIDERSYNQ